MAESPTVTFRLDSDLHSELIAQADVVNVKKNELARVLLVQCLTGSGGKSDTILQVLEATLRRVEILHERQGEHERTIGRLFEATLLNLREFDTEEKAQKWRAQVKGLMQRLRPDTYSDGGGEE